MARILRSYQNYQPGISDSIEEFRISIAGVQEKSAFLLHNNKLIKAKSLLQI